MIQTDFYGPDWMDLPWSEWKTLDAGSFLEIPKEPGIYRIRHRKQDRFFLEYIGESGDTRRRIQSLARGIYAEEMPYRDPHTAAPCLWAIRDNVGSGFEFSFTAPPIAEDEQHRKGIEAALIALHRRQASQSPTANFGRMTDGYLQSSYSYEDDPYKGGPLGPDEEEPNTAHGVAPTDWENWQRPRARDWMGLTWSVPYRLEDRRDANPPANGLYRIWYEKQSPSLVYVGESSNIPSRLYNHEKMYGSDAVFAYAERTDLDEPHKRQEIETELIGAYYLTEDEAPLTQFGHTERLDT